MNNIINTVDNKLNTYNKYLRLVKANLIVIENKSLNSEEFEELMDTKNVYDLLYFLENQSSNVNLLSFANRWKIKSKTNSSPIERIFLEIFFYPVCGKAIIHLHHLKNNYHIFNVCLDYFDNDSLVEFFEDYIFEVDKMFTQGKDPYSRDISKEFTQILKKTDKTLQDRHIISAMFFRLVLLTVLNEGDLPAKPNRMLQQITNYFSISKK